MLSVRLHLAVLILCSVNVDWGRVIFKSTVLGLAIHGSRETGRFSAIISVNSRENNLIIVFFSQFVWAYIDLNFRNI
jgi:hypothetical protein